MDANNEVKINLNTSPSWMLQDELYNITLIFFYGVKSHRISEYKFWSQKHLGLKEWTSKRLLIGQCQ